MIKSFDEAFAEYKLLAARANWRLRELEKQGLTRGTAYKTGKRAAAFTSGGKTKGFSVARPKSGRALKANINAVRGFLEDVTSTPTGYKAVADKIAGTISKKYGMNISGENLRGFFESGLWQKLDKQYGSDTAMKIVSSMQKGKGNVTNTLKSLGAKHVSLAPSEKQGIRDIIGEWQNATGAEADMIEAMFKG